MAAIATNKSHDARARGRTCISNAVGRSVSDEIGGGGASGAVGSSRMVTSSSSMTIGMSRNGGAFGFGSGGAKGDARFGSGGGFDEGRGGGATSSHSVVTK